LEDNGKFKIIEDYIYSLIDIPMYPQKIATYRASKVSLFYAIFTVLIISASKETVIVGSVFYKVVKWTITWFPHYTFIFGYVDYVSIWVVLIGTLIELGAFVLLSVITHYTLRLMGGKSTLPATLTIIGYSWIVDVIIVVGGLITIGLDIPSTIVVLLVSYVIVLLIKLGLLVRNLSIIHGLKWTTSLIAILLVSILFLIIGLAVIVV